MRQQLLHRPFTGRRAKILRVSHLLIHQTVHVQHAFIAALAQTGIAIAQVVINERNAAAAAIGQSGHRPLSRLDVVNPDAGDAAGVGILRALHPGRIANHGGQFRQAGERVHGNNAVDHFAGEQLQARGRAGQIRPGVTQQNAVAILLRLFFYPFHHLGAKGVSDIGDHHQDHIAASGSQLTRQQVRLIVALFDRLQHALTVFGFYRIAVVQHPRHRGHRDAGQTSNFLNRHKPCTSCDRGGSCRLS